MNPTTTRDATHNFHAPENWDPTKDGECGVLQVRAETYGKRELVQLVSTWKPTADELARLNAGGVIECMLLTTSQPPMALAVVDPVRPVSIATPDLVLRDDGKSSYTEPGTGQITDERTDSEFPMADAAAAAAPEPADEFGARNLAEATITINEEAHGHG